MKQTAVEWLESKFYEFETIYDSLPTGLYEYVNQAKEMEKQQMRDCFFAGDDAIFHGVSKNEIKSFKQYYNETFKNK